MTAISTLRILYDNEADNITQLTASASAGSLLPSNMLNDIKTSVWRSVGSSVTLIAQWPTARQLNMFALAFTNLTPLATFRLRGFATVLDTTPNVDSGTVSACGYQPLGMWNWGQVPLGVNAYRFGGISHGRVYFPGAICQKITVDIIDSNPSGYIEAARLITGSYWAPECNPAYDASFGYKYSAEHEESEAGDLRTERRPRRRTMDFNMAWLKTEADQFSMHEILLGNGMDRPLWVSLFPEHPDPALEQRCQLYCKLDGDHGMSHPRFGIFAAPLKMLEI